MYEDIIVYQGRPGAYSHLSCRKVFPDMDAQACESFVEAMERVEQGLAKLAMIPLENSTAGRVEEIYRQMPKTKLHIIGEHFEPVNHCLLGLKGSKLANIRKAGSHPQALAQCQDHLKSLDIEPVAMFDTAGAALALSQQQDASQAAIASSLAAELYGLDVLKANMQDVDGNTTRFLILSKTRKMPDFVPGKRYITSMMFKTRNIPAALYKCLGGFSTNNVNLVKLESYMAGGTLKDCSFHLDVAAHPDQHSMQLALQELDFFALDIRNLGTYEAHTFRTDHELIE
ncbi:prephenate dehydratase [Motiliproteus coralliicola]|uniref:prephenate dehydratase n=1 Tax=Motiliproteus coralliicola TaxID=2283196 RepID=A0A369WVX3_9GAMM|nr:prephenate dehydratase [Motiliproteus coralliicola]RDE25189.1 prephenate dehydratase [Motiliproteus coralliicola]